MELDTPIQALADLGIDRSSSRALVMLPLVEVAWADGDLHDKEKRLLHELGTDTFGLGEDAALLLADWLRFRPSAGYFARGREILRVAAGARTLGFEPEVLQQVVDLTGRVARATGGFLGFGAISAAEQAVMKSVAHAFSTPVAPPSATSASQGGLRARLTTFAEPEDDEEQAPAMWGVVIVEDASGRHKHVVPEQGLVIGSGADVVVRVGGEGVADRHCRVITRRRRFYVVDLDAGTGTFVNGERVGERRVLGGETIHLGPSASVQFKMGRRGE